MQKWIIEDAIARDTKALAEDQKSFERLMGYAIQQETPNPEADELYLSERLERAKIYRNLVSQCGARMNRIALRIIENKRQLKALACSDCGNKVIHVHYTAPLEAKIIC